MTYIIVSEHARERSLQRLGAFSLPLIRRLWREGAQVSKDEMRLFTPSGRPIFAKRYLYRVANYNNGRVLIVAAPMGLGIKVVTVIWRPLAGAKQ